MKTIALRFGENFAPTEGTIKAHEEIINQYGFVWYGKLGAAVSEQVINEILHSESPKILLIQSGRIGRYWAYTEKIQHTIPEKKYIPEYYRDRAGSFSTWFKITKIEPAQSNILNLCKVVSSQRLLSDVSRSSMCPFFVIETEA